MRPVKTFLLALCALATPGLMTAGLVTPSLAGSPGKAVQRQQVLISFDGAHDNAQWIRALSLGERTGARFTFFLSCTFLLTPDNKTNYIAPHHGRGASNVGFGKSEDDVRQRLNFILQAYLAGHEIASHGCGHFDGKEWSEADWKYEFDSFARILRGAWSINGFGETPRAWNRLADSVTGFRAPYLSTNAALFDSEKAKGLTYDASTVAKAPGAAVLKDGIRHLPLPMIPEGPDGRPVIAMDYNWFVRHSAGMENPSRAPEFEERAYRALNAQFEREYTGKRRPVQAGFHFTLMNDGAYWRALERFATDVCGRPDVDCIPIARHIHGEGPLNLARAGDDS